MVAMVRRTAGRSRLVVVLLALAALCLALAACGGSGSGGGGAANEVDMGVAEFQQSSITIHAGQTVHFVDPANGGGVHIICIGKNEQCAPETGAPAKLNVTTGIQVSPGDPPIDVTFANAGTYTVVCTIHPGMEVTINVQ